MSELEIKLLIKSGEHTFTRPIGRSAVLNFTILTSAAPAGEVEIGKGGKPVQSPKDRKTMLDAYGNWTNEVLPKIWKSGPVSPENMTGGDQWAVFIAFLSMMQDEVSTDIFQVVDG